MWAHQTQLILHLQEMPISEKYVTMIGVICGSAPVAWAIYAGLDKHGSQTKDGLAAIGKGIKGVGSRPT